MPSVLIRIPVEDPGISSTRRLGPRTLERDVAVSAAVGIGLVPLALRSTGVGGPDGGRIGTGQPPDIIIRPWNHPAAAPCQRRAGLEDHLWLVSAEAKSMSLSCCGGA